MQDSLILERWDKHSDAERRAMAEEVLAMLPAGFQMLDTRRSEVGAVGHDIAMFEYEGANFALVPGSEVEVGFFPFRPAPEQLESWQEVVSEYGMPADPNDYLHDVCTPVRRVRISPLLVECVPRENGLERAGLDHPLVLDDGRLRRQLEQAIKSVSRGKQSSIEINQTVRVTRTPQNEVQSFLILDRTRQEVVDELSTTGFRLLTADEWEYVCGAGARTLFRWGDECPCHVDPPDAITAGWDIHRRPNAFGLRIAQDPYQCEIVAEPNLLRGGDSGGAVCAGISHFFAWLPLATSFIIDANDAYWGDSFHPEAKVTGYFVRRVMDILAQDERDS